MDNWNSIWVSKLCSPHNWPKICFSPSSRNLAILITKGKAAQNILGFKESENHFDTRFYSTRSHNTHFKLSYCYSIHVLSPFSISWLAQSREASGLWLLCCQLGEKNQIHLTILHLRVRVGRYHGVLIPVINQFSEIIRHVNRIRNYFDCQINVTLITVPEINSPENPCLRLWVTRIWIILACSHHPGPLFPACLWPRTCAPSLCDNVTPGQTPQINR